jgi:hypothetical protein
MQHMLACIIHAYEVIQGSAPNLQTMSSRALALALALVSGLGLEQVQLDQRQELRGDSTTRTTIHCSPVLTTSCDLASGTHRRSKHPLH